MSDSTRSPAPTHGPPEGADAPFSGIAEPGSGDPTAFAARLAVVVDRLRWLPLREVRRHRELLRAVVQEWADLDADLEGEPRRTVPVLVGEPALIDQIAVVGTDVARAAEERPGGVVALARAEQGLGALGSLVRS